MKHAHEWDSNDARIAIGSLEWHLAESEAKGIPWAVGACIDAACASIDTGRVQAVLAYGYLLVYSVGQDWNSTKTSLVEHMLVNTRQEHNRFSDVFILYNELAEQHGCDRILVGNGTLRPGLARLYQRAGFVRASELYILEVP